jgi:RNA polymerase sigma-70 factor (ECF subfamily)
VNRSEPSDERKDVRAALVDHPQTSSAVADAVGNDGALLRLIASGNSAALETLYARYGRACFSLARRIVADVTLAQDVVQEVFLAVWRDPQRYDGRRGGFSTWLMSTTHHKAVDVVRREENQRKRAASAEALRIVKGPDPSPHDETWAGVRSERVRVALAALPAVQREALGLAYYGGFTQREVAGLTNTPLGTVKTRMLAGMRKLREQLGVDLDEIRPQEDGGVSPL